ncbi:MAG: hypothetical protein Kow00109_13430 [Acidobacteriota bacterium]
MNNRLREFRQARNWTQAELAERSGVPRSTIAAIEQARLTPSVQIALQLAHSLECAVEDLFGADREAEPDWAWPPAKLPCGFWWASVAGKTLAYPAEPHSLAFLAPDGWYDRRIHTFFREQAAGTLALASCDPVAGLLSGYLWVQSGVRLLSFPRNSRTALELLAAGRIHVAGIHLAGATEPDGHAPWIRKTLGRGWRLLPAAVWQEGVAFRPGNFRNPARDLEAPGVRWVRREPGSGAYRCQADLLGEDRDYSLPARDHWETARIIRHGGADAGVCHRFVAEQAELEFFPLREERYDLCYPESLAEDPRIRSLRRTLAGNEYRASLAQLPGFAPPAHQEEIRL